MVMLGNCLQELVDDIKAQFKMKDDFKILGMRLMDGPWDNTKFLEVEDGQFSYSCMLVEQNGLLKKIAPWKSQLKSNSLKK